MGLQNYWPISNGKLYDLVGCNHMTLGSSVTLGNDKNGNKESAISLNGGYAMAPSDIYFNSPFTISVWIYPNQMGSSSIIIDFAMGGANENILFGQSTGFTGRPYFQLFNSTNQVFYVISNTILNTNQWYFLVAKFDGLTASIYTNGIISGSVTIPTYFVPNSVKRIGNFIGKGNWVGNELSYSFLDELRIYNRCLSDSEIINLMNL